MALDDLFKQQRADPFAGKKFGRVFLQRFMAAGDRGNVYYGNMLPSNREVAVRLLNPELTKDPGAADAVLMKVMALRHTVHPNLVQVLEAGVEADRVWIASEFVPGEPLKALARKSGNLDFDRATTLARDIARGLEAIHGAGTAHGDLRPSSVIMDKKGNPKISGAGLPRLAPEDSVELSETIAPELLEGGRPDARADLYSLGCLYHYLLVGKNPGREPGTGIDAAIPPRARPVLEKLLAPLPENRFASAREAAGAIDRSWFEKEPVGDPRGTAARRKPPGPVLPPSVWTPPALNSQAVYGFYAAVLVLVGVAIALKSASATPRVVFLSVAVIPLGAMGWQLFKQDARLRGILAFLCFAAAPAMIYGGMMTAESFGGMMSRLNLGALGLSVALAVSLACLCDQERTWVLRVLIVAGIVMTGFGAYGGGSLIDWMKEHPQAAASIGGGSLIALIIGLALLTTPEFGSIPRSIGFVCALAAMVGAYLLGSLGEWRAPVSDFVSRASAQGTVAMLAVPSALVGHMVLSRFR